MTETVEVFGYRKQNERYWDGGKLHRRVVNKVLPIAEALYPGYSPLFLLDNATSHSFYVEDALRTQNISKGIGGIEHDYIIDGIMKTVY